MSIEIDEEDIDEEVVVAELGAVADELRSDKARLDTLLRNKTLHDPQALAAEVVQTIYSAVSDGLTSAYKVAVAQQQGIMELEDSLYTQTPKAMEALLTVLCEKKVLDATDQVRIMGLLVTEESESFLSAPDSAIILEQLENYEKLLAKTDANGQLSPLQNVIARVKEITVSDEEDEEDADTNDDTVESTGEAVEA